jgi:DNA-binding transcriptional LysR family regulator
MPDLDLLHSFVSVVDAGGFTRAGERVHRTQSTVSQQIRKLEEKLGCVLFVRESRKVVLTEDGERLLGYARRIMALSNEVQNTLGAGGRVEVVKLGLPDDFAVADLARIIGAYAHTHPAIRLAVSCDLSVVLAAGLEQGDLDVVLLKREPGIGASLATWPERLHWVGRYQPVKPGEPVPLIVRPQGCLYRERAIHALERAGRRWRIVYESPNLVGIQAALACGLGIALLDVRCLEASHHIADADFPAIAHTELALMVKPAASDAARELAHLLKEFCDSERQEDTAQRPQELTMAKQEMVAQKE